MLDFDLLVKHVADGVINTQSHPANPLRIYNYSARCQYERLWDDVTLQCRGLVMDCERIVARPFRKFFNDTEHTELPWHLPLTITQKMDGSLGILFCYDDQWIWSTRGSFISEQARVAAELFADGYSHVTLDKSVTYLFEIIYPENRIVVDYGETRDLILLGMIVTETGEELPLSAAPGGLRIVQSVQSTHSADHIRSFIRDDEEGYVVRFDNGLRVKIKGERYIELHKALSGLSSRSIWEALSQQKSVADLLAIVPDECAEWIKQEASIQLAQVNSIMECGRAAVAEAKPLQTRKEQAAVILGAYRDVSAVAFALLDGRDALPIAWKQAYPERRIPALTARLEN